MTLPIYQQTAETSCEGKMGSPPRPFLGTGGVGSMAPVPAFPLLPSLLPTWLRGHGLQAVQAGLFRC